MRVLKTLLPSPVFVFFGFILKTDSLGYNEETKFTNKHINFPSQERILLDPDEGFKIDEGVVIPRYQILRTQKRLKLKGCCLPERILEPKERAAFEAITFRTMEQELVCWGPQKREKMIIPGCKISRVKVESESLVHDPSISNTAPETSLELIVTFEAHADVESPAFTNLVTNGLGAVLQALHNHEHNNKGDSYYFDAIENLEVYKWELKGTGKTEFKKNIAGSSFYNIIDGNQFASGTNNTGKNGLKANSAQTSYGEKQQNQGMFILHNSIIAAFIVGSIFALTTTSVVFLRLNSKKKVDPDLIIPDNIVTENDDPNSVMLYEDKYASDIITKGNLYLRGSKSAPKIRGIMDDNLDEMFLADSGRKIDDV